MIPGQAILLAAAVVSVTRAAAPTAVRAQTAPQSLQLLDVPYLPQSEALCGGAASAMVMRYWGATGIYAESFSDLVVADGSGIRGEDLLQALRTRRWDARSFRGDAALVQAQLAERRPVIALIEDRPGRFHYVVIVGWSGGRVVAHDPARSPFRVLDEARFLAAWQVSGFWTMLVLPGEASRSTAPSTTASDTAPTPTPTSPCSAMVDEGVRLAGAGQTAEAARLLALAADACPASAAPYREMAGLHALREEWKDATDDARRAIEREPTDQHAWRILATSLFLQDDQEGALEAWNAAGDATIDLVDIKGLTRTRYAVAMRAAGLQPQTRLTPSALRTARRRLEELPSAETTRVSYRPAGEGRVNVEAVVVERPLAPSSPISLAAMGIRALTDRELSASLSSITGGGELWTASWRWYANRPRIAVGFETPAPFGGNWSVRVSGERETYGLGGAAEEKRRSAILAVSDWTPVGLRWEIAAGGERWNDSRGSAVVMAAGEQRLDADRGVVEARLGGWTGGVRTWTAALGGRWHSSLRREGTVLVTRAGIDLAGRTAPRMLWPGAGTGQGRDLLLRAHPLLDDGIVSGAAFGRTLAHAGAEWRHWMQPLRQPIRFAPALFADTARAWRVLPGGDRRWHTDIGVGVRIALPGAGIVRVDVARGLRDGNNALSVGWTR